MKYLGERMDKEIKILVTGGDGFIGSNLSNKLIERGYKNLVMPKLNDYDLSVENEVFRLFSERGPFDVVIHLAAMVGGINFFKENPGIVYYKNLMINTLVQEQARLNKVSKFIGLGSVLSYPKDALVPFKEESLWGGDLDDYTGVYGLTKLSLLTQGQAYRRQFGFNSIHLILTNAYGPGYNFNAKELHVIPSLIKKFLKAKDDRELEVKMWGTGSASREFIYINDVVEAIILAMEKYDDSEPVNVGSGEETTIKELAEKISALVGFEGRISWDPTKPEGKLRSVSDVSKCREHFGFEAKTFLDEGLKKTIDWYLCWRVSL